MMRLSGPTSAGAGPAGHAGGEHDRLLALESFGILDSAPEPMFDDLAALAAYVCDVPMAFVGFVDADRQWVKSRFGVDIPDGPRESSWCAHVMSGAAVLEIPDTRADPRFADHPMVTGDPHIRFCAGVPLVADGGHALGAVCVLDRRPHTLSDGQRAHLRIVADQLVTLLQLRRRARRFASEIEARTDADLALRQQQRMLAGVLEYTDVLIYAKDVLGRFVMANRALEDLMPATGGFIGATDYDFFDTEIADTYRHNDRHIMATREWQVFSEDLAHPDGTVHTYRSTKFPLIDDNGEVIGIGGVSTDVTELAAARAAHAAAEQQWRALVEQSPAAVLVIDAEGRLAYANPEAVMLLGAPTADAITSRVALDFVPSALRHQAEAMWAGAVSGDNAVRSERGVVRRVDGTEVTVEFTATTVNHAGTPSVQLEVRDVSAAAAAHAALKHSASTDPLTGVLNRRSWDARVSVLLAASGTAPMTIAVIDLDNFKTYNDTRGHTAGDALLQHFATAAGGTIRGDDVFARWGGEEFIVALPDTTGEQAEKILERLRHCVPFGQTCSIGYTEHLPTDTLVDTVIRADKALYQAKRLGRNQLSRL